MQIRFKCMVICLLFAGWQPATATSFVNNVFHQDVATVYTAEHGLPSAEITDILLKDQTPVVNTKIGVYTLQNSVWTMVQIAPEQKTTEITPPQNAGKVLTVCHWQNSIAAGCENGLYLADVDTNNWKRALPGDEKYSWALRNVGAITIDSQERLWFGAEQGVGYRDRDGWHLFAGDEGLPFNQFTCAAAGPDGIVWFGTENGAIRAEDDCFYYRHSRRWVADDRIVDIAVEKEGTAWIASRTGVSKIVPTPMTLDKKAEHFNRQVEVRHNSMGFVYQCRLEKQYDLDSWKPDICDNGGLRTALYGASQSFRYGVTNEPEAKRIAMRTFEAIKWLVDITPIPGYPARMIIPSDYPEPVNKREGRAYNKRRQKSDPFWKDLYPRYRKTKDGKYLWKCDTSSDELAGLYFFFGVYYDLVAKTKEEKEPVQEVVASITDHLIRNDFALIDPDGKPTRWARFSPDFIYSMQGWEQRGLNSMMMLSFLRVAYHITQDEKYETVASELRKKSLYHFNALQSKQYFPPENVVSWDSNLNLLSWYGLFQYETDPELLLMYRMGLEYAWLHISQQKNALWNILYAASAQEWAHRVKDGLYQAQNVFPGYGTYTQLKVKQFYPFDPHMDHVLEFLYRLPLDLIGYDIKNTHRLDIQFDNTPRQDPDIGWRVDGYALPVDERGAMHAGKSGFELNFNMGNGYVEWEGTFYLLPYYMARYHGFIE
ncbi:hypothetical protein GF406_25870 [candidate division KSB1 bacterium]|nr:hypothetical protein [candidate division KSB1 bacterium]